MDRIKRRLDLGWWKLVFLGLAALGILVGVLWEAHNDMSAESVEQVVTIQEATAAEKSALGGNMFEEVYSQLEGDIKVYREKATGHLFVSSRQARGVGLTQWLRAGDAGSADPGLVPMTYDDWLSLQ